MHVKKAIIEKNGAEGLFEKFLTISEINIAEIALSKKERNLEE